jgi:hypothetical protein
MCDKQVTRAVFLARIEAVARSISTGGLLTVSFSGHTNRVRDISGDEADGIDEALCLWDGELLDDDVWRLFIRLPAIRVLLITDTCHAVGTIRSVVPRRLSLSRSRLAAPPSPVATILHFAGCKEIESANGSAAGGLWTNALAKTYRDGRHGWWNWLLGRKKHSYKTWFDAAKDETGYQTPWLDVYGTSVFTGRTALT